MSVRTFFVRNIRFPDPFANSGGYIGHFFVLKSPGDPEEFISAVTCEADKRGFLFLTCTGNFLQYFITFDMSVGVVTLLEEININKDRADFLFLFGCRINKARCDPEERRAVEQLGQRLFRCQFFTFLYLPVQLQYLPIGNLHFIVNIELDLLEFVQSGLIQAVQFGIIFKRKLFLSEFCIILRHCPVCDQLLKRPGILLLISLHQLKDFPGPLLIPALHKDMRDLSHIIINGMRKYIVGYEFK